MATQCANSTRLALSAVLRQNPRSQFHFESRSSPVRHLARPRTPHFRLFSSTPQICAIQLNPNAELITELAAPYSPESPSHQANDDATPSTSSTEIAPRGSKSASKSGATVTSKKKKKDRKASENEPKPDKAKKVPHKKTKKLEHWQVQKGALEKKFPDGWNPAKKLSPDAMDGIRHLHSSAPERFTTTFLADEFKVSPEAIRRILKSKWRPSEAEMDSRQQRWERRHDRIWSQMAELGLRPSTKDTQPLSDANKLYKKGHKEE